jgi:hypothetical protein
MNYILIPLFLFFKILLRYYLHLFHKMLYLSMILSKDIFHHLNHNKDDMHLNTY